MAVVIVSLSGFSLDRMRIEGYDAPITYIDIRFFSHATEDPKKVIEAVQNILPTRFVEDIVFRRNDLRGHYGNPISIFQTRVKEGEIIKAVIENFSSRINMLDKETLLREINLHVAKGSLYLRLDKQAAFHGELKLGVTDPLRVQIRFKKRKKEDITQFCKELGLLQ